MDPLAGTAPSSGSDATTSNPSVPGANTFSSLKGLFKVKTAKCKHCGKTFTPKSSNPKI